MLYNQYLQDDHGKEDCMPTNIDQDRKIIVKKFWENQLSIDCIQCPEKNKDNLKSKKYKLFLVLKFIKFTQARGQMTVVKNQLMNEWKLVKRSFKKATQK